MTGFAEAYYGALKTRTLGRQLHVFDELDSTSAYLKRTGAVSGDAAVAVRQTAGRGRLGREWHSAADAGLYISFALPALPGELLPLLPLATGVAAMTACRHFGAEAGIKWPNDVVCGARKLVGILCESTAGRAVAGIGINLRQDEAFFKAAGLFHATSMVMETGSVPSPAQLAAELANALEPLLIALSSDGGRSLVEILRKNCVSLGREVRAISPTGERCGRAVDIDLSGRLVIEGEDGSFAVSAGEVQLRTPEGYV